MRTADELGRGTSTHDGVAIAAATLTYLATTLQPLCLFVTHYLNVAALHRELPPVGACYMSYLQEEGGRGSGGGAGRGGSAAAAGSSPVAMQRGAVPVASDISAAEAAGQPATASAAGIGSAAEPNGQEGAAGFSDPRIVMLHKLVPGVAPTSFALNVARMAGLPRSVCTRAVSKAHAAEEAAVAATGAGAGAAPGTESRGLVTGEQGPHGSTASGILGRMGQLVAGEAFSAGAVSSLQAEARLALADG